MASTTNGKSLRSRHKKPTKNHSDRRNNVSSEQFLASMASFGRSASNGDGGNQVRNEMNIFCITLTNNEKKYPQISCLSLFDQQTLSMARENLPGNNCHRTNAPAGYSTLLHRAPAQRQIRASCPDLVLVYCFPGQLYVHVGVNFFFFTQHIHILIILCH